TPRTSGAVKAAYVYAADQALPAAVALWGDIGRRLLQWWIKLFAGDCLRIQRAVWWFASDLRSRLAGPNPSALDLRLADRVVGGCSATGARPSTPGSWRACRSLKRCTAQQQ